MKNAFMKDVLKDIKKSKGRFLSIFAIIALGVAFFSGIKVSPIDMKNTADKYYDDYNFMDLTLYSTLGFNDEDIEELERLDGVKDVYPTYSLDAITMIDTADSVLKVMGMPLNDENYVNQYRLIEGRLPENKNECVVEAGTIDDLNFSVGSKIKLKSGTSDDLSESLDVTEYEIVGKVQTPNYLSFEKGTSNIGSGKISSFIVIPNENFKLPVYTEVYLTIDNVKELNSYSKNYFKEIDKVKPSVEMLGNERAALRFEEILDEANKKLSSSREEFEKQKLKGEEDFDSAKKTIEDSEEALKNGESELTQNETDYKLSIIQAENEISLGEYKINDGKVALENGKKTFEAEKVKAEEQINTAKSTLMSLEDTRNNLNTRIKEKENDLKNPNLTEAEKNTITQEINALVKTRDEVNNGITYINNEITSGEEKLRSAEKELKEKEQELKDAENTLIESKKKLEEGKKIAEAKFVAAKDELAKGKEELAKGKKDYEVGKETFEKEIAAAEAKLNKAESEIKNIEEPSWIVLDRNSHYSYVDYKNNADSIDKIAKVFPVFFFLVAALVCLTTMTRMVDEQRINIGALKALGYSKNKIASKYLIYSLSASFLGSIAGLAIGFTLFPIVIFDAYGIMYNLPKVQLEFNIPIAILITLVSIAVTTLSALFACYAELKESPANLMRPKAPKEGKRILIERMTFIWKRLSFIGKVTVRNIFRYKKRFFMTVFGIAGCTALLITGFGIKDSIETIIDKQFAEIFKYNLTINIDKDYSKAEKINFSKELQDKEEIKDALMLLSENAKISTDKGDKDLNIIVPENLRTVSDFINFKNRKSKEELTLSDNGIILSEKAADATKVKVGDELKIKVDGKEYSLKVSGITENYTFNYAYISPKYYKDIFDAEPNYNSFIVSINNIDNEEDFSKEIMEDQIVKGVSFNTNIKENFDNIIKSLNYVVLVMIVSAGALAFVVLYNLTNVNISERIREIATIKVLGFYDNEVSAYIYRENIILTIFGILFGSVLGVLLHRFIIFTVEIDYMMFGRNIDLTSFIFSAILTILFAVLVNISMYYKLKKVKMVESLKSVD